MSGQQGRKRIEELLAEHRARGEERFNLSTTWYKGVRDSRINEALEPVYLETFPRRRKFNRKKAEKDLPEDVVKQIVDDVDQEAVRRWESLTEDMKRIDEDITRIAPACADGIALEDTVWSIYRTVLVSSYSSQGWSAQKYAEGIARLAMLHCQKHGVQTHLIKDAWAVTVWAGTDEVGAKILRNLDPPTLEEQIDLCMDFGVNPRVYNPYLEFSYSKKRYVAPSV